MARVRRARAAVLLALTAVLAACSPEPQREEVGGGQTAAREAEPKTALIADFTNETGDSVFDLSLKHGLAVSLGQSPHVRVASGERVADALRGMNRSADDRVGADLAWEIAKREGIALLVLGTVRAEGSENVIAIEAVEVATGGTIARASARAPARGGVLGALAQAAVDLRRSLGEPEATLAAFNRSVAELTTSSLEALAHYAAGRELSNKGRDAMALPHYCRAIALDPEFRLAHVALDGIDERTRATASGC